ncbi:MAG TPA: type IX secretion system membrane protein PorP/SprF [Fulvivirga sp.]|nr:type IX secretion system membrane protein PorP/SprF [Fulvivirga sp.]
MKVYNTIGLFFILIICHSINGTAQQDPIAAQYHLNSSKFNPAYSGLYNRFIINSNIRRQWNGLPGNPKTNNLSISSSLIENTLGAGLVVNQDELGITTTLDLNLQLSYQIELGNNQVFSFGLQGGTTNVKQNQDELTLKYLDDPDFPQVEQSASKPNFGAGIALMSDFYFLGLSIPRMLNSEFKDGLTNNTIYKRHFYLTGAFIKDLTPLFKIKPGALIKYVDGAPISFDISANVLYNNQFWFGVFTRDFNAQGALLQFVLNDVYRIGYAIEIPTSSYVKTSFITHEISIGIDLAIFGNQDVFMRYF